MFIVGTYTLAVLLSVVTMLFWGSWPNTQKLVSKPWRFELFYWDYTIGVLVAALVLALTLGSAGAMGRPFIQDLTQADMRNFWSAALGGAIFNLGNILFVAAIAVAGMSVAFPIGAGIGLVLGVSVNYFADPLGNVFLLFGGVAFVICAILLSAQSYRSLSGGTNSVSAKGIALSILAGVMFGFFYRFIGQSMTGNFQSPEVGKLGPYSAVVCFAIGVVLSNLLFNTILMKKPVEGKPVPFSAYFRGKSSDHWMGILGGAIWGVGLVLSILSTEKAGFAISFGLGQGNALIAAVWGVFVWKEFSKAPPGTNKLIAGMFAFYILGIVMIILARMY